MIHELSSTLSIQLEECSEGCTKGTFLQEEGWGKGAISKSKEGTIFRPRYLRGGRGHDLEGFYCVGHFFFL